MRQQAIGDGDEVARALTDEQLERAKHDRLRRMEENERRNELATLLGGEQIERAEHLGVLSARGRGDERRQRAHVELGKVATELCASSTKRRAEDIEVTRADPVSEEQPAEAEDGDSRTDDHRDLVLEERRDAEERKR